MLRESGYPETHPPLIVIVRLTEPRIQVRLFYRAEIADILAKGVVRRLTTPRKPLEKDSGNVSHVGLISSENDRSL